MEISGEDDQTNGAGARPTGRDLQQERKTGGIKHTCQVIKLESRSGVSKGPHLLIRQNPQVNLFNLLL